MTGGEARAKNGESEEQETAVASRSLVVLTDSVGSLDDSGLSKAEMTALRLFRLS
jgi:hypothetical protein